MTQDELEKALAASPSPDRVTPEYFRSRIAKTEFHRIAGGTLTICVLTIDNGFQVTGQSACADPANYRQDIGEKIASDNAERALWPLLGFLVCEGIYRRKLVAGTPTPAPGFARYRSHKVVEAAPIKAAEMEADGSGKVALGDGTVVLVPEGFQRSYGDLASAVDGAGAMLVRYPDGYLSWSPMAPFLEGYTAEPADYRDRVRQERAELADKLVKLRQFIAKDPRADNLMRDQADAMTDYLDALDQRIAAFPA